MFFPHSRVVAPGLLIGIVWTAAGCGDGGLAIRAGGVGPSPPSSAPVNVARGAMVQPALVTALPVAGASCPVLPPFIAPFTLVFDAAGRSDLFLAQVHLQFIDRVGVAGRTTTLRHAELVARFGPTALPVVGTRAFPFSFPFGCVGAPAGTLVVIVLAGDSLGRTSATRMEVPVRLSR